MVEEMVTVLRTVVNYCNHNNTRDLPCTPMTEAKVIEF